MRSTSLRRRPILFKLWCRCCYTGNRQCPQPRGEHRSRPATAADAAATTSAATSANAATVCATAASATTAEASVAATATDASATGTTADASVSATDAAANDVSTTRAKPRNIEQDLALCINPPSSRRRRGCHSICHGSILGQEGCCEIGANRGRRTSGTEHTSPRPRAAKRRGESTR